MVRRDERTLPVISLLTMAVTSALFGLTTAVVVLVALRFGFGVGDIGLRLSLQSHVAARVESGARGRALSLIGGSFRLSLLVGPLLGGYLADAVGFTWPFLACGVITAVGLAGAAGSGRRSPDIYARDSNSPPVPVFAALWRYRLILAKVATASGLVVAVRQVR